MTKLNAQISQRVILLTIISVLGAFLTYQLEAWFSRNLGPVIFGDFKFLLRALHMGGHIGLLGQDAILVMLASRYDQENQSALGSGLIAWVLKTYVVRVLLFYTVLLGVLYASSGQSVFDMQWLSRMSHDGFYIAMIIVVMAIPVLILSGLCEKYFVYRRMFFTSLTPRAVILPVVIFCIYQIFHLSWRLDDAVLVYVLSIACILAFYMFRCFFLIRRGWSKPKWRAGEWWRTSLQFFSINVIVTSGRNIVFFLLEFLGETESEVGYFAAILAVIIIFHMMVRPVEGFLRPYISRMVLTDNAALLVIMRKCNRLRFALVSIYFLILVLFAPSIMGHFGPAFHVTVYPMIFMASCFYVYTLGQPNVDLLAYSGHQAIAMRIWLLQIALSVIIAVCLIPYYGVWAAVLADGSTMALSVLLSTCLVYKKLGYHAWVI